MAHKPHSSSRHSSDIYNNWRESAHKELRYFFRNQTARIIDVRYSCSEDADHILKTFQCGTIIGAQFLRISLKELSTISSEPGNVNTDNIWKKLDSILERHISNNSSRLLRKRIWIFLILLFLSPCVSAILRALGVPDDYSGHMNNAMNWILTFFFLFLIISITKISDVIPGFTFKVLGFEGSVSFGSKDYGADRFLAEISKDLVYISKRHHRTVVFDDLSELAPEIRNTLFLRLDSLNQQANDIIQQRSKWRKVWYSFWGKEFPISPIRFLYTLEQSSPFCPPHNSFCIDARTNSAISGTRFRIMLERSIAIDSDDLNNVCNQISSAVSNWQVLMGIHSQFRKWKALCEKRIPQSFQSTYAKLLALAAYCQLDPNSFHELVTGPALDTIPISTPPDLDNLYYALLTDLRQNGYLDCSLLPYLSGPDSPESYLLKTLRTGNSEEKSNILRSRIFNKKSGTDCDGLQCHILSEELLLREPDSKVVLLLAEYLDLPAETYLASLMICLSHRHDSLYNLYHPSGYLNALKLTADMDPHLLVTVRLHGELYFKNTLLSLSRFSDEELRAALQNIDHHELLHHLHLWMNLYHFSAYHPMHWSDSKRWDADWSDCARVLLICLKCEQGTIPQRLKHKRFGKKTLRQHSHTHRK